MTVGVGSPIVDVAIGMAFVFFLLSLIVSAGTEATSWLISRRATDLERGVRGLLRDESKARAVLDHPLLTVRYTWRKAPRPSYITPRSFSLALIDTLAPPGRGEAGSRDVIAALRRRVDELDPSSSLARDLRVHLDAAGDDLNQFRASIETWFNSAMDRVSGVYRRWAQIVACVIAFAVTVAFNADALRIADRLANDQTVRAGVVNAANAAVASQEAAAQGPSANPQGASPDTSGGTSPLAAGKEVNSASNQLNALHLPIGWGNANGVSWSTPVGWLVTFLAVSLGAPFWFDTLSRLAHLRTTGRKPSSEPPPKES